MFAREQEKGRLRRCFAGFVHVCLEPRRRNIILTQLKEARPPRGRGQRPATSHTLNNTPNTMHSERTARQNLGKETREAKDRDSVPGTRLPIMLPAPMFMV